MDREYPFLQVKKPDGEEYTIYLEKIIDSQAWDICLTIGRLSDNHIVLADSEKKVSRHHCSLQYENNRWWISDRYSSNGTFLQREIDQPEIDVRSKDKVALKSGDRILILGKLSPLGQLIFWQLEFIDPGETIQILDPQTIDSLEYSLSKKNLVRNIARRRDVVYLGTQERSLIDYMSRQNRQNDNQPAICEYDELIKAVWQNDNFGIDRGDIQGLVCRIRKKIERNTKEPQFLKTVPDRGYLIDLEVLD